MSSLQLTAFEDKKIPCRGGRGQSVLHVVHARSMAGLAGVGVNGLKRFVMSKYLSGNSLFVYTHPVIALIFA